MTNFYKLCTIITTTYLKLLTLPVDLENGISKDHVVRALSTLECPRWPEALGAPNTYIGTVSCQRILPRLHILYLEVIGRDIDGTPQ